MVSTFSKPNYLDQHCLKSRNVIIVVILFEMNNNLKLRYSLNIILLSKLVEGHYGYNFELII